MNETELKSTIKRYGFNVAEFTTILFVFGFTMLTNTAPDESVHTPSFLSAAYVFACLQTSIGLTFYYLGKVLIKMNSQFNTENSKND